MGRNIDYQKGKKATKKPNVFCFKVYDLDWDCPKDKTLPEEIYVQVTDDDVIYARQTLLRLPPTAPLHFTLDYLAYDEIEPLLKDLYGYNIKGKFKYDIVQRDDVPLDAEYVLL